MAREGKRLRISGRRIGREYTPASFAALMWNHAPAMWSSMGQQGLELKPLTQQDAGDLFGYFYSIRFFDKAADAARGKRLFTSNHCSECHAISESAGGVAKPVANWQSLGHPIELASAMWRHSTNMRQAFAAKGFDWPTLSGQDLADILLYVRNLPATRGKPIEFTATGENGKSLFDSKGCIKCHTGKLDLAPRLKGKTLNDIATAMWMITTIDGDAAAEPRRRPRCLRLLPYLGASRFLEQPPACGRQEDFASNHCTSCHGDAASGARPGPVGTKGSVLRLYPWFHRCGVTARQC